MIPLDMTIRRFSRRIWTGWRKTLPLIHGVRTERYKYTRYISQKPPFEELFDLQKDPSETKNLVGSPEHRALLDELCGETDRYVEILR